MVAHIGISTFVMMSFLLFLLPFGLEARFPKKGVRLRRASAVRNKACEMLIAIDEPLFRKYGSNVHNVTDLAKHLVKELNEVYHKTVLVGPYSDIYFRIAEVRVLYDFCTECNQTQKVYLNEFSKMRTSEFCLAHVFTYRDFPEGVQGLAWRSTVCRNKYNTGFTTLLNHKVEATTKDSVVTFAHEIGHNFGSDHDERAGCQPGHIMSESGTNDASPTFSSCSLRDINKYLHKVLYTNDCFADKPETDPDDFGFCGDGIVEGAEECDCGLDWRVCFDPCCYPARLEPSDLYYNESATPCRFHRQQTCLNPWMSTYEYAIIAPWIFIAVMVVIMAFVLNYDWRHKKLLYGHVTQAKELIRSETEEQMAKRIRRQQSRGQVFTVVQDHNGHAVNGHGVSGHVGNGQVEEPKPRLISQIKNQIKR